MRGRLFLGLVPALALVLGLAACGEAGAGAKANRDGPALKAATTIAADAGSWRAADICAGLDRAAATRLLGSAVTRVQGESLSAGADGLAVASRCSYTFANGAALKLETREDPEAPEPQDVQQAIDEVRTGHGGMLPVPTPVPRLGRAAFWGGFGDQLQLFLDDRRFLVVTLYRLPPGEPAKERAIAVARHFL